MFLKHLPHSVYYSFYHVYNYINSTISKTCGTSDLGDAASVFVRETVYSRNNYLCRWRPRCVNECGSQTINTAQCLSKEIALKVPALAALGI
jgi:hypothetical protein